MSISDKQFDKAIIIHQDSEHTIAAVGMKSDPAPSGIGVFINGPPIEEGKPLVGDVLFHKSDDGSCDVTHLPARARLVDGPAQVATPQYRSNYDRIFGQGDHSVN